MRILFLTLMKIYSPDDEGIYMDLMKCFAKKGHQVHIISPLEKKEGGEEEIIKDSNISLVRCKTGNLFGVSMLEKGTSQAGLASKYLKAIDKYFHGIKFDLILYSTPPISLAGVVQKIKKKTGAATYLLLKDIFPQNAVDIGILSPFLAKILFRNKEKKLYEISDYIGCMSPANVDYLLKHNDIDRKKVEVCPNSIKVVAGFEKMTDEKVHLTDVSAKEDKNLRSGLLSRYKIPADKIIFLYGGNLGRPQDIPFIIRCIDEASSVKEVHFVICGDGTEYGKLNEFATKENPKNFTLIKSLPKAEYDALAKVSDVGMIFLDHRFTIPNFPSRLLSYLKERIPVLVCTDINTDIGKIAMDNEFGLYSVSDNEKDFASNVVKLTDKRLRLRLGENGYKFLLNNYTVEKSYEIIMGHFKTPLV